MILVTGGCGYIGSHVVKYLQENNISIVVVDNLVTGHRKSISNCPLYIGDIGNRDFMSKLFKEHPISTVIHLAGYSLVSESQASPGVYWQNNVDNGRVLLELMVANNCREIVFSSTAAVYGEPTQMPIKEDHTKKPINTYGQTKLAFELLLQAFEREHGLRHISLRYFNAAGADASGDIGEDHSPESHLIPLILKVATGKRNNICIYGEDYPTKDGTCVRDYIHVNDLAEAHLLACRALKDGVPSGAFNLGNGAGHSVKAVVEVARRITGHPIPSVVAERRLGDPAVLVASADKAREILGWQPKYSELETIISSAWNWHSKHPEGYGRE